MFLVSHWNYSCNELTVDCFLSYSRFLLQICWLCKFYNCKSPSNSLHQAEKSWCRVWHDHNTCLLCCCNCTLDRIKAQKTETEDQLTLLDVVMLSRANLQWTPTREERVFIRPFLYSTSAFYAKSTHSVYPERKRGLA